MQTFIAIDAGTTNTRAWLVESGQIVATASRSVGVRDTAMDGHNGKLVDGLRELIDAVRGTSSPRCVAAAGMITSSLGLREIVHCDAPAGARELAARQLVLSIPEICDLPIHLFPGVRSGDWTLPQAAESCDMMRGEETLCIGLAARQPGQALTVLNLGSHWKAIQVNPLGQMTRSWTTLSGELLHAIMTQTILSSALPAGRPESTDLVWCRRGSAMTRQDGFSRVLFETRLWEVRAGESVTPVQRLSFLIGALIEDAWSVFQKAGFLQERPVQLVGSGAVAEGWHDRLSTAGIAAETIDAETAANSFVRGVSELLAWAR